MTINLDFEPKIKALQVNPSDFIKDDKRSILTGGFCSVTFQKQKSTNTKCAVKSTKLPLFNNESERHSFEREVKIFANYPNPGIVPFIGYSINLYGQGLIYLYEMPNGSLDEYMKNTKEIIEDHDKFIIAYGVALTMKFLHENKIIHRDLKPSNILLDESLHPYITDFGTSKEIVSGIPITQTTPNTTAIIMAPEFINDPCFSNSFPIDVFSYGMCLYQLITGNVPFPNMQCFNIFNRIVNGKLPLIPQSVPEKWRNLIKKCWDKTPSDRPTFEEIVNEFESPVFLSDEIYMKKLEDYKKFLKDGNIDNELMKSRKAIQITNKISPILKKMRNDAESGDVCAQYNYICAQYNATYGVPDYDEVRKFATLYANRKGSTSRENIELTAEIEYYAGMTLLQLKEEKNAYLMLRRASDHGNSDASFQIAELQRKNKIPRSNKKEIEVYYKRAADFGNIEGIRIYSHLMHHGIISQPNMKSAFKYLKMGSDNGDPELMYEWAKKKEFGWETKEKFDVDTSKDIPEAMRLMKLSAEKGYVPAMIDYGIHLLNGFNVTKDENSAAFQFKKAAEISLDSEAILYHTIMLSKLKNDEGEETNETLLNRSVKAKETPDNLALYGEYILNDPDSDDKSDPIHLLCKGAASGSIYACHVLGKHFKEDEAKSKFFYDLAANYCHCLDTFGFFTPIQYEVYHCNTCNIDICPGCAFSLAKEKTVGNANAVKKDSTENALVKSLAKQDAISTFSNVWIAQSAMVITFAKIAAKNATVATMLSIVALKEISAVAE